MDDRSKLCGVLFDEMSLDSRFILDKTVDKVYSSSHSQVAMVRGICKNWKQPIYYEYDSPMTKSILLEIIHRLESIGLKVVCTTSDFGAENQALWKNMGVNEVTTYFQNPFEHHRKIHVFADVPHMLKLIRNHLIDDGFQIKGTTINASTLETLINANGEEKKLCPALGPKLIQLTKAERMRVRRTVINHCKTDLTK
jgi:hypothetical protein